MSTVFSFSPGTVRFVPMPGGLIRYACDVTTTAATPEAEITAAAIAMCLTEIAHMAREREGVWTWFDEDRGYECPW